LIALGLRQWDGHLGEYFHLLWPCVKKPQRCKDAKYYSPMVKRSLACWKHHRGGMGDELNELHINCIQGPFKVESSLIEKISLTRIIHCSEALSF